MMTKRFRDTTIEVWKLASGPTGISSCRLRCTYGQDWLSPRSPGRCHDSRGG